MSNVAQLLDNTCSKVCLLGHISLLVCMDPKLTFVLRCSVCTVVLLVCKVPLKSTLVHEVFSTGRPDLQSSVVTLNNSNVVAGTSPAYQITLYDEYANQIPLGFLSPQQNVTLTVDLPNNSSRVIPVSQRGHVQLLPFEGYPAFGGPTGTSVSQVALHTSCRLRLTSVTTMTVAGQNS